MWPGSKSFDEDVIHCSQDMQYAASSGVLIVWRLLEPVPGAGQLLRLGRAACSIHKKRSSQLDSREVTLVYISRGERERQDNARCRALVLQRYCSCIQSSFIWKVLHIQIPFSFLLHIVGSPAVHTDALLYGYTGAVPSERLIAQPNGSKQKSDCNVRTSSIQQPTSRTFYRPAVDHMLNSGRRALKSSGCTESFRFNDIFWQEMKYFHCKRGIGVHRNIKNVTFYYSIQYTMAFLN